MIQTEKNSKYKHDKDVQREKLWEKVFVHWLFKMKIETTKQRIIKQLNTTTELDVKPVCVECFYHIFTSVWNWTITEIPKTLWRKYLVLCMKFNI